jgi:hypothetical protein
MVSRKVIIALSLIVVAVSAGFARNILEKKTFYLNNTNKTGQARFWVVFLGTHDVKITRAIPGEGDVTVQANVNLQLISSGYIEGNGYGEKGKIECLPTMLLSNGQDEKRIVLDSIDYIYDFGRKVRMLSGDTGSLIIDVEGNKVVAKKFLMREYKLTTYYGEEILKEGSQEIPLMGMSLTQEGVVRAQKAQATLSATQN